MCLNRTSEGKVMTIWISRELPFFNFECLDISFTTIVHPCQKLWQFELDQSFRVQFRASRYIMCLILASEWKFMTIWFSWELMLFYFERFDASWASIVHPCQKLWPYELDQSFRVQSRASQYIMSLNGTSEWNIMTIWISRELPLFYFERLDGISWASIVHPCQKLWPFELDQSFCDQSKAPRYIMCLNRKFEWNMMTIWIFLEHLLFNFKNLDTSRALIERPCQNVWSFEFY